MVSDGFSQRFLLRVLDRSKRTGFHNHIVVLSSFWELLTLDLPILPLPFVLHFCAWYFCSFFLMRQLAAPALQDPSFPCP